MKGIIKQYRPAYVSGYENQSNKFNSLNELLNIDWVKYFTEHSDFYKFSISIAEQYQKNHALMAEYKNGESWYVIGFIDKDTCKLLDELPIFNKD
jgi:chloramphenicol O-acetyltransferase